MEQILEVFGNLMRHTCKCLALTNRIAYGLKGLDERNACAQELRLQLTHALKDLARSVDNHERGQKNTKVNVDNVHMSMTKGAETVDALNAGVGGLQDAFLTQADNQGFKADALGVLRTCPTRLHQINKILCAELGGLDLSPEALQNNCSSTLTAVNLHRSLTFLTKHFYFARGRRGVFWW